MRTDFAVGNKSEFGINRSAESDVTVTFMMTNGKDKFRWTDAVDAAVHHFIFISIDKDDILPIIANLKYLSLGYFEF